MREILFRAKRLGDGEWVDGNLFVDEKQDKHEILLGYVNYRVSWEVDPKTVGQFTGLTDKNGKKIFEGDIVRIQNDTPFEMTGHIAFYSGGFELHDPTCDMYECLWYEAKDMEVLGNVYDNPELLEG